MDILEGSKSIRKDKEQKCQFVKDRKGELMSRKEGIRTWVGEEDILINQ